MSQTDDRPWLVATDLDGWPSAPTRIPTRIATDRCGSIDDDGIATVLSEALRLRPYVPDVE